MVICLFAGSLDVAAQVGINNDGTAPSSSAMLDVKSTSKGILFPRMTIDQRNAITSPAEGLVIYCTNCASDNSGQLNIYSNGTWNSLTQCSIVAPSGYGPGYSYPSTVTSIRWEWYAAPGASGYKFNTTNNYSTASDLGNTIYYIEQSLTCNTAYTRYVWAYGPCGVSTPLIITGSTAGCFPTTFFTESFEAAAIGQVPPPGWAVEILTGTNQLWFSLNGVNPTCTPYNGSRMVEFDSYHYSEVSNRLKCTTPISFSGQTNIAIDFAWHVDPDLQYMNDYVVVEASDNGVNWYEFATVYRVGPVSQWKIINIPALSYYTGTLYIAFRFVSQYGNSCHLDFVHVTGY